MNLRLLRHGSIDEQGTFGTLVAGDFTCKTIEQPWNDNEPFKSCIPSGEYNLIPHYSEKYGQTFAMVNLYHDVAHYKTQGVKRYACLIHAGNYVYDTQGCILPGETFSAHEGHWMVTNSKNTLKNLLSLMEDNNSITIEWENFNENAN